MKMIVSERCLNYLSHQLHKSTFSLVHSHMACPLVFQDVRWQIDKFVAPIKTCLQITQYKEKKSRYPKTSNSSKLDPSVNDDDDVHTCGSKCERMVWRETTPTTAFSKRVRGGSRELSSFQRSNLEAGSLLVDKRSKRSYPKNVSITYRINFINL